MKKIFIFAVIIVALGVLGWFLPKSEVNPKEEFNLSGQAKAVENETDLWQSYSNEKVGFSLKYPYNVSLGSGKDASDLILTVESTPIDNLDYSGVDKAEVLQDMQLLKEGQLTKNSGRYGGLPASEKVVSFGKLSGQEMMVLSRFEVCDVTFARKVLFYHNGYQVVITLKENNIANITDNLPQYFKVDEVNCGKEAIWDFDNDAQTQFYRDLKAEDSFFTAQAWFDTFDQIVDTLETYDEVTDQNFSQLIQGRWVSLDDKKSVIEFRGNTKKDIYSGEEMNSSGFGFYDEIPVSDYGDKKDSGKYLVVQSPDGNFAYEVIELTDETLDLIYLPRGNLLRYMRSD